MNEETRNAYKIFVGKPKGMWPLGRPRRRLEDNIRMNLKEIWCEGVHWMHVAHDTGQ